MRDITIQLAPPPPDGAGGPGAAAAAAALHIETVVFRDSTELDAGLGGARSTNGGSAARGPACLPLRKGTSH